MNREEAIAIIRKEYLCVDRDCDIDRSCGKCDLMMPSKEPILEAYKIAIKALEQMPTKEEEALLQKWRDNRGISMEEFEDAMNTLDQEPCEDAISRQAVLDAIDVKAWEFCDYLISKNRNDEQKPVSHFADNLRECVREELPSVNPQPCEDAIDRAEAIKIASGYCHPANVAKELAKMPPVTPQPKTGHWIDDNENEIDARYGRHLYKCSECNEYADMFVGGTEDWWDIEKPNYCPNCGAWMVEPQESERV